MTYKVFRYNRYKLYEQVWSKPVTHVAKEYGLSDNGLRKICKKLKVPMPGVGYWHRKKHGYKVKKTPLPWFKGPEELVVERHVPEERQLDDESQNKDSDIMAFEKRPENRIEIPDFLTDPHPRVARTERSIKSAKRDEKGLVRPRATRCLDVCVSPECIDRALRIMDSLVKALESRGLIISFDESGRSVLVVVSDEKLRFGIEELLNRKERPLSYEQKRKMKQDTWYRPRREYDYYLTGKLMLSINEEGGYRCRKRWADGKKQRLEHCLHSFIIGLTNVALKIKVARAKRERVQRELREAEHRRYELLEKKRREEAKIKDLLDQVKNWRLSQEIRDFLKAFEKVAIDIHGNIADGSELSKWLEWAHQQADRFDPLAESPPSILDEKI